MTELVMQEWKTERKEGIFRMELLRFFVAGNVDDGKSTLTGRLLFDSGSVSTDIIETLTNLNKLKGRPLKMDLALLTDGLRAEREQGITIDVAYKYFTTSKRKFIIADTPGHLEYTRNMFTGASSADLAIILIDAKNGITDQTKRHSIIASILRTPHVVVCINKMDAVNYSKEVFNKIKSEYLNFAKPLNLTYLSFIPVNALEGDNVVFASNNMKWYAGKTLLSFLEDVVIDRNISQEAARYQIQYVLGKQSKNVSYAGNVLSGNFKKGQKVKVLPLGIETTIDKIEKHQKEISNAEINEPIVLHLKSEIEFTRGNSIVPVDQLPMVKTEFTATFFWMDNHHYMPGQEFVLQQNSFRTTAVIQEIQSHINIHTHEQQTSDKTIQLNDLCKVLIKTTEPLVFDSYASNRTTGAFILIAKSNNTVAAGIID